MRVRNSFFVLGVVSLVLAACGSASTRNGYEQQDPSKEPAPTEDPAPILGDGEQTALVPVSLSGTVYAPNASLPMANTLVYLTATQPEPIPEGAYCDECVTLGPGTFAVSAPDGTFEITTEMPEGDAWLVVQKGQFRRVRLIRIPEGGGALEVEKQDLTLPGRSNPSKGDDVPKMVILKDSMDFDKIDESLEKLGIKDFDTKTDRSLLDDEEALLEYQVVFIPCGSSADPHASSETSKANLEKFVASGGKLYVTDWSYEFVRQPFPGYLSWDKETSKIGSAATGSEWDAPATATDQGLADWLDATGETSFEVIGNWTTITSVNTIEGLDPKGEPTEIEPKIWVTAEKAGQSYPTTVSFEHQCGRVLFSTYHTEGEMGNTSSTLLAQEKALLYSLLEVGVCLGDLGGVN